MPYGEKVYRNEGWKIRTTTGPIMGDKDMDEYRRILSAIVLPEMVFHLNTVELVHEASGTIINFNALDALAGWKYEDLPPLQVRVAEEWRKAREHEIQQQKAVQLTYDWTYTTPYTCTVAVGGGSGIQAAPSAPISPSASGAQATQAAVGMDGGASSPGVDPSPPPPAATKQPRGIPDFVCSPCPRSLPSAKKPASPQATTRTSLTGRLSSGGGQGGVGVAAAANSPSSAAPSNCPAAGPETNGTGPIAPAASTAPTATAAATAAPWAAGAVPSSSSASAVASSFPPSPSPLPAAGASEIWQPTTDQIDRGLLMERDPILFYDELPLYESDLDDNGVCAVTVKLRVMPRCWLVLLRLWVRVDGSMVRLRETRLFCRHDKPDKKLEVLQEVKQCEGAFNELRARGAPDEGPAYADADSASQVFQAVAPVGLKLLQTRKLRLPS